MKPSQAFMRKFYRSDLSKTIIYYIMFFPQKLFVVYKRYYRDINLVWVGRSWCMDLFSVPAEGIPVEESPWTGRAGQPHTQVGPAHMSANGYTGGGRSLVAHLNLATINPLTGSHVNTKGCHVGWDGDLQGLRNGQRGDLLCLCTPSATDARGSRPTLSDSRGGALDTFTVAAHWHLLAWGRPLARAN